MDTSEWLTPRPAERDIARLQTDDGSPGIRFGGALEDDFDGIAFQVAHTGRLLSAGG
ncbi:MAG: hypothetical protein H7311_00730 [Ramlibacter sp.]|nr:hypothetical protein [Cryobacterium sp.]